VSFFKRILNLKGEAAAANEQRQATRYAVGPDFPLKTVLNLYGRDADGKLLKSSDGTGRDWSGRMFNLSATGASMRLPNSAFAARGEACQLKFVLGESTLVIPAYIAHFRVYSAHATCGVALRFPDDETQASYQQLLYPVSIGASLAQVDPKQVTQDADGFIKEEFKGENSHLVIWRAKANLVLQGFDFRMGDYGVRWTDGLEEMDCYAVVHGTDDLLEINEEQKVEVRWLFCLSVPNLPKGVPTDVREFLGRLVA